MLPARASPPSNGPRCLSFWAFLELVRIWEKRTTSEAFHSLWPERVLERPSHGAQHCSEVRKSSLKKKVTPPVTPPTPADSSAPLSRGQRKRLQRRSFRSFEASGGAVDTASLDLSALSVGLDAALATTERRPSGRRPGRRAQAASDEREMKQFQDVLAFQAHDKISMKGMKFND